MIKKSRWLLLINLIPMILQIILWFFTKNIGFIIMIPILIIAIVNIYTYDKYMYLKRFITLLVFSDLGIILTTALHYYLVSNDFETPIVGGTVIAFSSIEILIFMVCGYIIKLFKNK